MDTRCKSDVFKAQIFYNYVHKGMNSHKYLLYTIINPNL